MEDYFFCYKKIKGVLVTVGNTNVSHHSKVHFSIAVLLCNINSYFANIKYNLINNIKKMILFSIVFFIV